MLRSSNNSQDQGTEVKFDENGNIDTAKLEQSLIKAIELDVKYKQTDNMKKRAVKVATSYEEFKAMVDCAQLKTVSRQEIESLRQVKTGWTKSSKSVNDKANILSLEEKSKLSHKTKISTADAKFHGSRSIPRSYMEFQRDFRRIQFLTEKIDYLIILGSEKVVELLKTETDAELFEELLLLITNEHDKVCECSTDNEKSTLCEWLQKFIRLKNFDLLLQFLPNDLITKTYLVLQKHSVDEVIIKKYLKA